MKGRRLAIPSNSSSEALMKDKRSISVAGSHNSSDFVEILNKTANQKSGNLTKLENPKLWCFEISIHKWQLMLQFTLSCYAVSHKNFRRNTKSPHHQILWRAKLNYLYSRNPLTWVQLAIGLWAEGICIIDKATKFKALLDCWQQLPGERGE